MRDILQLDTDGMRSFFEKVSKLLLLLTVVFSFVTNAQPQYYNNNTSAPSNAFPWATVAGKGTQNFFPAGSITGAYNGLITDIYYKVTPNTTRTYTGVEIKLGQTTNTSLDIGIITTSVAFTTVYSQASVTLTSDANGWLKIPLPVPFHYNPAQALVSYVFTCSVNSTGMSTCNYTPGGGPFRTYINNGGSCTPIYSGQDNITCCFGIDMTAANPCSGKPDSGRIEPTVVCHNTNSTISVEGISNTFGITYQWYEGPNGVTWAMIPAATNQTLNINIPSPRWYACVVTCTNSNMSDTIIQQVTMAPFYYCYCNTSVPVQPGSYDIGLATLTKPANDTVLNVGNIDTLFNRPTANKSYTPWFYQIPPPPLYRDSTYILRITQIHTGATFAPSKLHAYLDFNRDGIYDPSEKVAEKETEPQFLSAIDTFKVPANAEVGLTGLRLILSGVNDVVDPCSSYSNGETEDYVVDLRYAPCTGPINAGVAQLSDSVSCVGYPVTLYDTTYTKQTSGVIRYWEESPDNYNWGKIAGSDDKDTVTVIVPGKRYYRVRMVCTSTGDTTFSQLATLHIGEPWQCYCYSIADGGDKDTSDVGTFKIKNFTFTVTGPHVSNVLANRGRTNNTYPPYIELHQDSTYQVSFYHILRTPTHGDAKVTLFMDFDNDYSYDIPTERVWTGYTTETNFYLTHNVTIPMNVIMNAPTGMRLIVNNNVAANVPSDEACGPYTSGETEDYVIMFRQKPGLGIDDVSNLEALSMYPNPTSGELTIRMEGRKVLNKGTVEVRNLTGQVIHRHTMEIGGTQYKDRINLSGHAAGVYFVQVTIDGEQYTRKIMLQ